MKAPEPVARIAVARSMRTPDSRPLTRRAGALACGLAAAFALASGLALATPDDAAQHEIDHLLEFIAASKCTFVRSGEQFTSEAARDHLAMKYSFTKFRMSTADVFVKYLATESSTTGEPYKVICEKKERPAGAWLADELKRYRRVAQTSAR